MMGPSRRELRGSLEVKTVTADQEIIAILHRMDGRLAAISEAIADSPPEPISPHLSYSRRQAARLLHVSTWVIDRARKAGLLKEAQRLGQRDVRLTGVSLLRFQRERHTRCAEVQLI